MYALLCSILDIHVVHLGFAFQNRENDLTKNEFLDLK